MADPTDDAEPKTAAEDALERDPAEAAPEKRSKAADPQEIKDRNRRIREEAAAKRRAKRSAEVRRAAPARNLDTSEIVDDAMARTTHAVSTWLRQNFNVIQYVILAAVVGGIGYQIYSYRRGINVARATDELALATQAERARVGDSGDATPDRYTGLLDTRPVFATEEARLKAAAEEYRKVQLAGSSTTSALASLGLAGILFDQGKYKDAKAEYEKVKSSVLAKKDPDARGRAFEGIGLSLEADGNVEAALAAFRELENADVPGFKALAEYQQARLLFGQGKRAEAKPLLEKALKSLTKADDDSKKGLEMGGAPKGFLESQVRELLGAIDPSAVPKKPAGGLDAEQLQRLQSELSGPGGKIDSKRLQELLKKMSKSGGPAAPGAPVPSPEPAGSAP